MSQFSRVVVIGAEKWAFAAELLCPTATHQDKKVGLDDVPQHSHNRYMYMYITHLPMCSLWGILCLFCQASSKAGLPAGGHSCSMVSS